MAHIQFNVKIIGIILATICIVSAAPVSKDVKGGLESTDGDKSMSEALSAPGEEKDSAPPSISLDSLSKHLPDQGPQPAVAPVSAPLRRRRKKRQSLGELGAPSIDDQLSTLSDGELAEMALLMQTMRQRALVNQARQQNEIAAMLEEEAEEVPEEELRLVPVIVDDDDVEYDDEPTELEPFEGDISSFEGPQKRASPDTFFEPQPSLDDQMLGYENALDGDDQPSIVDEEVAEYLNQLPEDEEGEEEEESNSFVPVLIDDEPEFAEEPSDYDEMEQEPAVGVVVLDDNSLLDDIELGTKLQQLTDQLYN